MIGKLVCFVHATLAAILIAGSGWAAVPAYDEPFAKDARYDESVPTPESVLGFPAGTRAASHAQTLAYFKTLANARDNVEFQVYGDTHEGRELMLLIVSSPDNMRRLDEIRANIAKLADPRKLAGEAEAERIISDTPAVAWMSYSIHGDELSGTDAAIQLAYHLAASQSEPAARVRENAVVVIDPLQNPDGRERILAFQRIFRGDVENPDTQSIQWSSVWPRGRGNHYWFDLNRDFFILSQPESRARVKAIQEWWPQFFLDCHEMFPFDTYLFSPPRQPINYNNPDNYHKWTEIFARDQARAFDRHGWSYYTREWFEQWYPGYAFWAGYTGAIPVLYEQATTQASAVKHPGGTVMTFRESVHHQFVSSLANLGTVAENREALLRDYYQVKKDTVAPPEEGETRYYLFPPADNETRLRELMANLRQQGIEIEQTRQESVATNLTSAFGETIGESTLPEGTYVIPTRQPQKMLVNAILEFDPRLKDEFLAEERFNLEKKNKTRLYTWSGWAMPPAYGIEAYSTPDDFAAVKRVVDSVDFPEGSAPGNEPAYGCLIDGDDDSATRAVTRLLERGLNVRVSDEPFQNGGREYPRGSFLLRKEENPDGWMETAREAARETGAAIRAADTALGLESIDLGGGHFQLLTAPRTAVLTEEPIDPVSYGYTWHFLDIRYHTRMSGLNVHFLADANPPLGVSVPLGVVDLRKYNTLIVPNSYNPGALLRELRGPAMDKIRDWIENGGTLIAMGSSVSVFTTEEANMSAVRERGDVLEQLEVYEEAVKRERAALTASASQKDVYEYAPAVVEDATPANPSKKDDPEKRKRDEEWARRFGPRGALFKTEIDPHHWLTGGVDEPLAVMTSGSNVYLSKAPAETPVRFADGDELRVSGLAWPEARERFARAAYLTRESKGRGQIILFPYQPHDRGYLPATQRLLWNAVFLGPGLGAEAPPPW